MTEATGTVLTGVGGGERGARGWFVFLVVWLAGLTGAALLLWESYEGGIAAARGAWLLVLMCFYLSLCNTFVPLPSAWIVLLAASPAYSCLPNVWANVVLVATVSGLATVVANLTEYHLLGYFLGLGLGRRIRGTRVYGWALRWFDWAPFKLLTLVAFVPVPVDAIRWMAILRGYSRWRFGLAYFVGRVPRYFLLAGCSVVFSLGGLEILLIQVGLVVAAIVGRLLWVVFRGARNGEADAGTTVVGAAGDGRT